MAAAWARGTFSSDVPWWAKRSEANMGGRGRLASVCPMKRLTAAAVVTLLLDGGGGCPGRFYHWTNMGMYVQQALSYG
jgi:hypothetical protein